MLSFFKLSVLLVNSNVLRKGRSLLQHIERLINKRLRVAYKRGIFSSSQINGGFSQPKIEISNLTVSSYFSDRLLPCYLRQM
ncbi:hypothetical protein NIES4075_33010 [Tolypothrix sp. NIES-4075]|uniref:hypothetical protein n=1 Tax=Tolypothrix sp. NIES-4075 TaxID=2005459 RepID=UPI000B5C811A|nr:hypothetical protein [Tolypothrix sp. NIES-4075]GAX42300.1 hypothetical protein NIES4075_33010 [Tolypothrix sp. NIES-4075]